MPELPVAERPCVYEPQPGDTVVYRGRQWVVVANPKDPGGGLIIHNDDTRWFSADRLTERQPNWRNANVEYSMFSHIAGKGFDLDDWEAAFRAACAYFHVETSGWLDKEIAHARAVREYRDASNALSREMFPETTDVFISPSVMSRKHNAVTAELARRGIFDPDGPMVGEGRSGSH